MVVVEWDGNGFLAVLVLHSTGTTAQYELRRLCDCKLDSLICEDQLTSDVAHKVAARFVQWDLQ